MATELVDEAIALLEKANANLEPELLDARTPRKLLGLYSRVEKLGAFGRVALARKLDDATELARLAGTSIGRARETVETARVVAGSPELAGALRCGDISFEQASEISRTEAARPGSAAELLDVAKNEPFHVLRDCSRRVRLDAEQKRDLGDRQHAARRATATPTSSAWSTSTSCSSPTSGPRS